MKIIELDPNPPKKVRFDLSAFKNVPNTAGCYVLTTFGDDILYIGQAINLFRRFQEHLDNPEKVLPTEIGKSFWFYFLESDKVKLNILERTWLGKYERIHGSLPIFNKVHPPV